MATNLCQRKICPGAPARAGNTQKKGKLTIQCDELWSFVDNKGNKQWVWLALDADTRKIVGVYIGARNESAAHKLWESLPPLYCQCAVAYTDFGAAYGAVLPSKRHRAVGKETGRTSYIERFNNTLRQRVSRLVGKTLSFSKSLENYIGAIWYFIHYYNASLLV
jgi:IS1 family transposase